jgi:subtilisin family serine protease
MLKLVCRILSMSFIVVLGPVFAADKPDGATVNFQYRDELISDEFIAWVARYGARAPVTLDASSTIDGLVTSACGEVSVANRKLFSETLKLQNIAIDPNGGLSQTGSLMLPPCLPTPKASAAPRIVLPKESFGKYYNDIKNLTLVKFEVKPIQTLSTKDLDPLGTASPAPSPFETLDGWNPSDPIKVQRVTEQLLAGKADPSRPLGEVAWDVTKVQSTLKSGGVSDQIVSDTIDDFLKAKNFGSADVIAVKDAVGFTKARWTTLDGLPTEGEIQNLDLSPKENGTYFDQVAWIEPGGNVQRQPTALVPGDLVVVPSVASQYVQIPVDGSLLPKTSGENSAEFLEQNPPPATVADNPATVPEVALLTSQSEDVGENTCSGGKFAHWGTADFARDFRNAAVRSRMLSYRADGKDAGAEIVVIDSGFVRAADPGAFRDDLLTVLGPELSNQQPPVELEEGKRIHGTAVAGLALGGPDLWGLTSALGLSVKVRPATIFEPRFVGDKLTPVFNSTLMTEAIEGGGDIFNISFASKDKNAMEIFKSRFLTESRNELFIVAAGNNNMNDDTKGVDLAGTDLRPQLYGGNDEAPNMILVAAIDGPNLAIFSNFSTSHVSIAAPGCGVKSWKPVNGDKTNAEDAFSGTSFATPIVAYTAAVVKALMPPKRSGAKWVRARILASSDLTAIKGVEDGRVLNPVKAVSIYEDVVDVEEAGQAKTVVGRIALPNGIANLCDGFNLPADATPLKFATDKTPEDDKDSLVYYMRDGIFHNEQSCKRRADGTVPILLENGEMQVIKLKDVRDIVFRIK